MALVIMNLLKKIKCDIKKKEYIIWKGICSKIKAGANDAFPFYDLARSIVWVTGTRTASLVGLDQVAKKHDDARALIPTGSLLDMNIVPLTGELGFGILSTGVNRKGLSGTEFSNFKLAHEYSCEEKFICDLNKEVVFIESVTHLNVSQTFLRLKASVLRLIHCNAENDLLRKSRKHISEVILPKLSKRPTGWENKARLIRTPADEVLKGIVSYPVNGSLLPRGTLVKILPTFYQEHPMIGMIIANREGNYTVCINANCYVQSILKNSEIEMYQDTDIEKIADSQKPLTNEEINFISEKMAEPYEHWEIVEAIVNLFDQETPLPLSETELSLVNKSFPLIWGSTSKTLKFKKFKNGSPREYIFEGALKLGSDIDVLFTKKNKIPQMQKWLEERGLSKSIKVMPIRAGFYLASLN